MERIYQQNTITTTSTSTKPTKTTTGPIRRFLGVRQRPSGRWVAEIKDSSQRVRLWLGTFDSPEEAARAYDDAARALRGENARTNFAHMSPSSVQSGSLLPPNGGFSSNESEGHCGLNFSSLKAKLSKNLQSIMARTADTKSAKTRVSDHNTFASIFHFRSHRYKNPVDLKNSSITKSVQPSIIVPHHVTHDEQQLSSCWDSSSATSDSSNVRVGSSSDSFGGQRLYGCDSDVSDIGDGYLSDQQGFMDQLMGWIDSPEQGNPCGSISELLPYEFGSSSKRFKVSSSVMVPPTFSASDFPSD